MKTPETPTEAFEAYMRGDLINADGTLVVHPMRADSLIEYFFDYRITDPVKTYYVGVAPESGSWLPWPEHPPADFNETVIGFIRVEVQGDQIKSVEVVE